MARIDSIAWNEIFDAESTQAPTGLNDATLYIHLDVSVEDWKTTDTATLKADLMKLLSIADPAEIVLQVFSGTRTICILAITATVFVFIAATC